MKISDLNEMSSVEDFRNFLESMIANFRDHPEEWENSNLEDFLVAMASWIDSIDSYVKNTGDEAATVASWKTFAKLFCAAKIYE